MVRYGIYTVKELERFARGLTPKRDINILSECQTCDFVYEGGTCLNCYPWNTVRWRVTCPRELSSSVIIICVLRDSSSNTCTESVSRRATNPISLRNGCIENTVKWSLNVKRFMVTLYHSHVCYVGKSWKGSIYAGPHMMVNDGYIVIKPNVCLNHYRRLNKREI